MIRIGLAAAALLMLAGFQSAALSPEGEKTLIAWRAELQKAKDATWTSLGPFKDELRRRVTVEQAGRRALDLITSAGLPPDQVQAVQKAAWKELTDHDADNTAWLKVNLPSDGWFRISRDGLQVASGAWLIVQHSPDREWQKEILARIEPLITMGEAQGQDFALLYDRVQLQEGKSQRYGSQAICRDGKLIIDTLEDPANVDARRASVGLGPIAEYEKMLGVQPC